MARAQNYARGNNNYPEEDELLLQLNVHVHLFQSKLESLEPFWTKISELSWNPVQDYGSQPDTFCSVFGYVKICNRDSHTSTGTHAHIHTHALTRKLSSNHECNFLNGRN